MIHLFTGGTGIPRHFFK